MGLGGWGAGHWQEDEFWGRDRAGAPWNSSGTMLHEPTYRALRRKYKADPGSPTPASDDHRPMAHSHSNQAIFIPWCSEVASAAADAADASAAANAPAPAGDAAGPGAVGPEGAGAAAAGPGRLPGPASGPLGPRLPDLFHKVCEAARPPAPGPGRGGSLSRWIARLLL